MMRVVKEFLLVLALIVAVVCPGFCEEAKKQDGSGQVEKIREEIVKIMLVKADTDVAAGAEKNSQFENNVNSVKENRNKMKLSAVTRAIALGQRAVALATQSGTADIDKMTKMIEEKKDVMNTMRAIAKLQAQHLQKHNEITALRAKILELDSIEHIVAGSIYSVEEENKKKK